MRVFHLLLPVLAVAGSAAATFVMCVEPKGVCNGTKVDLDVNPKADSVKGCAVGSEATIMQSPPAVGGG